MHPSASVGYTLIDERSRQRRGTSLAQADRAMYAVKRAR